MYTIFSPIYLDWSFWAVIIALLAAVLSQLPPVYLWFKKAKIDFELYSMISLSHKIGNTNLSLHVIINNIGGRKLRIREIEARILRDGKEVACLPVQNFLQESSDENNVLFTSFSLSPGEEWGHIVNLLKFFGREEERQFREMEGRLKSEILEKGKEVAGDSTDLVEASPENVEPFIKFFNEHFIWVSGEYELKLKVMSDVDKATIEKSYRFTIFEYYEAELRKLTDEYKYGAGIYWNSKTPQSVNLEIKEN